MTSEVIHYFPPSFSYQVKRALLEVKLQKKLPKVEREIREAWDHAEFLGSDYGIEYNDRCFFKFSFNFGYFSFNSWGELAKIQKIAKKLRAKVQFICYTEDDKPDLHVDLYLWFRIR
ncbi:MAG: hypothetical protein DSO07_10190 [Thermoproteota archaeon]|jgi:hypothetical protein|uniref:Uncharacterized protein n=1 Tax=Candidatus Methanodesulfokora washburnensis TaxID=2478471 RepID=A0A3R9RTH5_9CREN|nr:hypothetical protein [Candidatus Methanodesulfokores washburnensis]RSN78353.1 hypothetical protein D6D85_01320 [Candidatus Methanodesulfokores washburnensis]TDA39701.1 MAG: hypothetical protein DSO07_10190 [Candidatus Korarchaeota archaeon]